MLITFGIKPTHPETGYGYIERGPLLETRDGIPVHRVVQFREKPDRDDGRAVPGRRQFCLELGDLRLASPDDSGRDPGPSSRTGRGARADLASRSALRPRPTRWRGCFPRSCAYRSTRPSWNTQRNVRVLEVPYQWNDVGDWRAVASLLEHDAAGNAIQGNVVARDTTGSILISDDGGLVAVLGVDDLVVVHSGKATLVARKDQLDKLKALVEGLGEAGYGSHL